MSFSLQLAHVKNRYYREIACIPADNGHFRRLKTPIRDERGFRLLLDTFRKYKGLYVSVYSYAKLDEKGHVDYETAKIDRIYMDFDDEDEPQTAVNEALMVTHTLTENSIYPRFCFSGKKGIAMYIEFVTVDIRNENKKEVITAFFDLVKRLTEDKYQVELTTLDTAVRGDIARVSRLPNTQHASGYYCIPLHLSDLEKGIEHIRQLAAAPRKDYDIEAEITDRMLENNAARQHILNFEKDIIVDREADAQKKEIEKHKTATYIRLNGNSPGFAKLDVEAAKAVSLSQLISSDKKIICPFHPDTDPSLIITHDKNLWHCFGCGRGGTPIDYVMERDGLDFVSAVRLLNAQGVSA